MTENMITRVEIDNTCDFKINSPVQYITGPKGEFVLKAISYFCTGPHAVEQLGIKTMTMYDENGVVSTNDNPKVISRCYIDTPNFRGGLVIEDAVILRQISRHYHSLMPWMSLEPGVKFISHGHEVPYESLSSGERSLYGILYGIYTTKNSLVLINQPEAHLDLVIQEDLFVPFWWSKVFCNNQLIINTASPNVVEDNKVVYI